MNYAVKRLEREKVKALNTLTPAGNRLICEYSDKVTEKEKQIEELKAVIAEKEKLIQQNEKYCNNLKEGLSEKQREIGTLMISQQNTVNKLVQLHNEETIKKIVDFQNDIRWEKYKHNRTQCKYLSRFNESKPFFTHMFDDDPDYTDEELKESYIMPCHFMFSSQTLLININPQSGRMLEEIDNIALKYILERNNEYKQALHELNNFKETNPSRTELMNWTYQKGMELLPLYRDKIF